MIYAKVFEAPPDPAMSLSLSTLKAIFANFDHALVHERSFINSFVDQTFIKNYVSMTVPPEYLCSMQRDILTTANVGYQNMLYNLRYLSVLTPDEHLTFKNYYSTLFAYNYCLLSRFWSADYQMSMCKICFDEVDYIVKHSEQYDITIFAEALDIIYLVLPYVVRHLLYPTQTYASYV